MTPEEIAIRRERIRQKQAEKSSEPITSSLPEEEKTTNDSERNMSLEGILYLSSGSTMHIMHNPLHYKLISLYFFIILFLHLKYYCFSLLSI